MIELYEFQWKYASATWFNLGGPCFIVRRPHTFFVWPWVLFNHVTNDDQHWWGLGVLQIGKRALFYVGHSGVSVLFVGKTS